ncbi:hypothetical protein BOTCAL_0098g00010 [Botryotinia calthae]|uniref:Uncharacterized protein n=1 Tax=Botryotinia calthae TaxID=38488 RepID=A0A4Y8D6T5_9HELO|nr:hypothetical protein BOTCAL_0098g00010 [Botryotinia calthae]
MSINSKSDKLKLHLAEKKAKTQRKVGDAVKELYMKCRHLKCDPPIYFLENGKTCVSLAGSYAFSKAPDFKARNKAENKEEARLDVAKQALRWIEHNTPPPYYWRDIEAEKTVVDLMSELALGIYENDTSPGEVDEVMLYLEETIEDRLCELLESKGVTKLDPAKHRRALDAWRFPRPAEMVVATEHASDKEVSKTTSAPNIVYSDQSQQTEADLSFQPRLNDATTSVPTTTTVSTIDGTTKPAYVEKVDADVNELVSESDSTTPRNLDDSTSDSHTTASGFILRDDVVATSLPGINMETVVKWMTGSFNNYCDYHNDHDRMHIVSTILSKDGDSFVSKVRELGANVSVNEIQLLEFILQQYNPAIVERLWGSKGLQTPKNPGAYDLEQFLNICDDGFLPVCDEISKKLRGGAKVFLSHFLNWHKNGMLSRVLSLSARVGDRTQEFIDRLLKLENTGLLPLIDAVIAETEGKPVPLLESFLRWNKNDVAQRLLDFDVRGEMSATSLVEAALDFGRCNILKDVRSLLNEAQFNGKPDVFFRKLRKWQRNKSLKYLDMFDQVTSDKSPEFLDLALRMCETGLMKHITENRELIGDRPYSFFNDMFGVSRLIVNGEAIVVARGELGNFTRDLTPNLRPKLLSTSLSYKLQSMPAWMESISGAGGTDPSQLEFENVGSTQLNKFINLSLDMYRWGVHHWASNNLEFIGTDPALFFNQLFHLAAVIKNGFTSPIVLEAIAATQNILTGKNVSAGTGGIGASTSSNQMSSVVSPSSDTIFQPLQAPSKSTFSFEWQDGLPESKSTAPPKQTSIFNWETSLTGSKSTAPPKQTSTFNWEFTGFTDSKSTTPSSKLFGSSSAKGKKTNSTLPKPTKSAARPVLGQGKCVNCPRQGYKLTQKGPLTCEVCRSKYD